MTMFPMLKKKKKELDREFFSFLFFNYKETDHVVQKRKKKITFWWLKKERT